MTPDDRKYVATKFAELGRTLSSVVKRLHRIEARLDGLNGQPLNAEPVEPSPSMDLKDDFLRLQRKDD